MNRNEFLRLSAGVIAGFGMAGIDGGWARAREAGGSGDATLDESWLVKGLTAMVQANGWFDAHWGAAVIAGYYLCNENEFDEITRTGIRQQLETVIEVRAEQFTPLPEAKADERRIPEVAAALRPAIEDGLRAHGHAVIYASLATKALREAPHMATPKIINGLCGLSRQIARHKPERPQNVDGDGAYPSSQAMIAATFDSLARFKDLVGDPTIRRPNFTHMVTHTEALLNLDELGYAALARTGHLGHRAHIGAPVPDTVPHRNAQAQRASLQDVMSGDFWNDEAHRDSWRRKWSISENPNGYWIAAGHLFKVLYAYHRLIRHMEDAEQIRLCSAVLLERYINPAVQGG
ncbi:hypothetical protein GC176_16745 [bacterium]|nr:hypothetical protein [bacterium]